MQNIILMSMACSRVGARQVLMPMLAIEDMYRNRRSIQASIIAMCDRQLPLDSDENEREAVRGMHA